MRLAGSELDGVRDDVSPLNPSVPVWSLGLGGRSVHGGLYGYLLPSLAREYIYSYEDTMLISDTCLIPSISDDSMVVKCSEHLATSCLCHVVSIPS